MTLAVPERVATPMIAEIQVAVCEHYLLDLIEMRSARRGRSVSHPRQVAMYLSRALTAHSLPEIGRRFGDRDHTTVLHATRAVQKRAEALPELAAEISHIRARVADIAAHREERVAMGEFA